MQFKKRDFRNKLFWNTVLFLCVFIQILHAQVPSFTATHYSTENIGLSHNSVLNMAQDQYGFIWLSTMDGLNRFDGKSVKVFRHSPDDSTTLSDSFIHGVVEHSSGLLLVGTRDGGINILDPKTERITRVSHLASKENNIPNVPVSLIFEDSESFLWAGFFRQGMGFFDIQNQQYFAMDLRVKVSGEKVTSVNSILELTDGSFLISSLNGAYFISAYGIKKFKESPESSRIIDAIKVPFSKQSPEPNSNNLYIDNEGALWMQLVLNGLKKVNSKMIPQEVLPSIRSGSIKTSSPNIILEREKILIVGAGAGHISLIDKITDEEQLIQIKDTEGTVGSATVFQDNDQNIWFYSWGGGFHLLKEQKGIQLFNNEVTEGNWPANFMLAFEDEDNGLWIGTNNGLAFMEEKGSSSKKLSPVVEIEGTGIWSLERDDRGLWVATRNRGLLYMSDNQIKTGNNTPRSFTIQNSFLLTDNVHQVFRDSRGWLWIGYEGEGIQIIKNVEEWLNGGVAEIESFPDADKEVSIQSKHYRRIFEDSENNMWLATTNQGFIHMSFSGETITKVTKFNTYETADVRIEHNDARNIYEQNDSTFWFATYGGGIYRWRSTSKKIKNFKTNDGLANNSTYGILGDEDPRFIWISTNNGISRLDTETMKFTSFTTVDNLQNNEFNTGAYLKRKNGELVFGGVNGFNIIDSKALALNQNPPEVYLTTINLFNSPIENDSSSIVKNRLNLDYDQNFLSFEFAALDYEKPLDNEYAYKMEGVDADWVYSGNRNFADYPNLDPGEYIFKVKAANGDGIWNEEGTSLSISVYPPWWHTWWFRLITGLFVLTSFILAIRYISQRKLREQIRQMEIKHKLRNERERISRDLHDHVGAQLANIISGLSLVDKYNEVEEREKSNNLMRSLKGDAQVTIKQLRETIWALNQNELDIRSFIEHLKTYFKSQSALNEVLKIQFDISGDIDSKLSSPQALNLFRIIQEAAQNTLKYADATTLDISMARHNGALSISIKDDGTFKSDKESFNSGYGMKNMQKRAAEIDAKVEVFTVNGTEVRVLVDI